MRLPPDITEEPKTNPVGNISIVNLEQKENRTMLLLKTTTHTNPKLKQIQNIRQSKVTEDTRQRKSPIYSTEFK